MSHQYFSSVLLYCKSLYLLKVDIFGHHGVFKSEADLKHLTHPHPALKK